MPKLASRILCLLAALGVSMTVAPAALAADQAFSTRFAQTIRGDVRAVGNTSLTCQTSAACTAGRAGTGGSINNNDFDMDDVDIDGVAGTFNSSSATVALPAGATVAWAGLYWGADTSAGTSGTAAPTAASKNTVRFDNGSGYTTVTASAGDVLTSTPQPTRYRGFKDVTSLMTATGNGTYTVANIQAGDGADRFAGWSLIIAYVDSTLPVRRVSIWDGLGTVDATHSFSTNIAPFFTPANGPVTTNIGLLSFEGDRGIATETMTFAGSNLNDAQNPANNGFNSTFSSDATLFTAKSPNYVNQMGTDVDSYRRTGLLTNLQSSATLAFSSTQDYFMPSMLYLVSDEGPSVNTSLPTIGGVARDGQVLTASPGTWLGTPTITYTNQWQRCDVNGLNCVNVPGATGTTYTLTPADVGSTIRVVVVGNNDAGASSPASSNQTSTVVQEPPATVTPPVVSGTTQDGRTLTATLGTWTGTAPLSHAYQWQRCDSAGANCVDIVGSTGASYVQTGADVGQRIRVKVTATNAAGSASSTSAPSSVTVADPPANVTPPVITGTTRDGSTLSVNLGTWTGTSPLAYSYQWERCDAAGANCVDIAGDTGVNHTLIGADIGHEMRVKVTATNAAGAAAATTVPSSVVTARPPANTVLPVVSGTTQAGSTLSVSQGTWTGTGPLAYSYQWQRCDSAGANCVDIAGQTGSTHVLTSADTGHKMRAKVTATNGAGSASVTAAPSSVVAAQPPANSTLPQITGTTQDGNTLTAAVGTWTGTAPLNYSYQWQRCDALGANCVDIAGATDDTYDLIPADIGHTIRIEVTAANGAGDDTATSTPSPLVATDPLVNTLTPTITGEPTNGETLTAHPGTWTGTGPIDYGYQWQLCDSAGANCVDIAGADEPNYDIVPGDVGHEIRVVVTAGNGTTPVTASSTTTDVVGMIPPVSETSGPPTLSRTTTQGDTLTADPGDWSGDGPIVLSYQWQRCDSAGLSCVNITGATDETYVLTPGDVGHTIVVIVTGTNDAGSDSAASGPSAVVTGVPVEPDPDADPDLGATPTPSPTHTPVPVDPQSGVLDDSAQQDDLGATVPGNLIAETSCQQLAGNSKYRRIKLAGIGTVRLRAYTSGPAMKLTPMQVTTQVTGGKAKSISYTLDGKALKAKKARLHKASVTPALLQRVGTHTLKAMVKGKKGAPKPVVLTLSTVPCKTLFTAQRWKTNAGAGLRLRVDARSALQKISFKIPAGLLPKQTTKVRKVGFVRFFVAGSARRRFNLALPKKGTKAALLTGAGKPSITYARGGFKISGVPANAAVAEVTLYRENKLDKKTAPKLFKLGAKVLRAGSGLESFSVKPKAPR